MEIAKADLRLKLKMLTNLKIRKVDYLSDGLVVGCLSSVHKALD